MNCCSTLTEEQKEERRRNRQIEKQIQKDKKNISREIKLLLLGAGESGKSTFVKQMRIIHQKGFTDKERNDQIKFVYENLISAMQSMITAMNCLNIEYKDSPEICECIEKIKSIDATSVTLDNLHADALKKLWEFEGIQETYRQRRHYQLSDSTEYFFSNIDRVAAPKYIPDDEDMLRVRVRTQGVQEYHFLSKKFNLGITDVGGQRSERKHWLSIFDSCTSMMFISAISEYDQVIAENNRINRLIESVQLFGSMANYYVFREKSIILFLNKTDLLERKICESDLVDYFPEFVGEKGDAMAAKAFLKSMFVNQIEDRNIALFVYFTCATDTKNIQKVFKTVQETILETNLGRVLVK